MSTQDELEEILSNFFVEYKAAHLPAEMNLAVNKALAALTSREQAIKEQAALEREIKVHDEYWHMQHHVSENGIGPVALANKEAAQMALKSLHSTNNSLEEK